MSSLEILETVITDDGIVVPSFAAGCTDEKRNLVMWSWSDSAPHKIRAIDDKGRLPKSRGSWT